MEGRLIHHFLDFMNIHCQRCSIKQTGLKWTSLFIAKLLNLFYWPQWVNRNEFVYKLNKEVVQNRHREELKMEVYERYSAEKPI